MIFYILLPLKLQNIDLDDYNIGMIEAKFLIYLIQVLHYNYVKNYAKNKIKLYCFDLSKKLILFPNWHEIKNFYTNIAIPLIKHKESLED